MAIEFNGSAGFTLGVELELQIVDSRDFSLRNLSDALIGDVDGLGGSVKYELLRSNIEINTRICRSVGEARRDLYEKLDRVIRAGAPRGVTLCSAGTHPFSSWRDQEVTPDERYLRLLENLKIIARRFNIFGQHVHVGVPDGEKCIYTLNRMITYLPHLLALSANSPFWEGDETGLMSYRTKVFENLPIAGLPFYFYDWQEYSGVVESYIKTGTIETIRELWWDVRPHPDFGTIEVRVCDSPTTVTEAASLAAIVQALVMKFCNEYDERRPFKRPHPFIVRENKWRAARYGLDGRFITEDGTGTAHIRDSIEDLVRWIEGEARELGSWGELASVADILAIGDGAGRQLRQWKRHGGDLTAVTRELTEALAQDVKWACEECSG